MTTEPENILVTCPFEPSHRILKHRIQSHISKCSKNHPNVQKVVCPFDVTHVLDPISFEQHVRSCPNRASLNMFIYEEQSFSSSFSEENKNIPSTSSYSLESTENWDSCNSPSYKPNKNINPDFVRDASKISGLTPTEKDKIRMEDAIRRRLKIFSR